MSDDAFGFIGTTILGRYRLDAVVGSGTLGVVYRGMHLSFEHPIAVKCLRAPEHFTAQATELFLARFQQEAKQLAKLNDHGSIVRVIDVGLTPASQGRQVPFLVLEWLQGIDLGAALGRRPSPYGEREALRELRPVVDAVAFAHRLGLGHRNLKPSNLFLAETPRGPVLKVLGFGIAKPLQEAAAAVEPAAGAPSGFRPFSPRWGAPEQFRPKEHGFVGPWTDVHALGLILTELLTKQPALGSDERAEQDACAPPGARPTARARGASVSDALEALSARAVALSPTDRFADAGEMLRAMDALLAQEPIAAPAPAAEAGGGAATVAGAPVGVTVAAEPTMGAAAAAWGPGPGPWPPQAQAQAPGPYGPPARRGIPDWLWGVMALMLVVVLGAVTTVTVLFTAKRKPQPTAVAASADAKPNANAVKVELYVMSECPYGVQTENAFKEVVEKLGPDLDLRVDYIGQKSTTGELSSMHGAGEVKGDLVQICAKQVSPRWFDLAICQNKNAREADTNWVACANELSLPVELIRTCAEGDVGKQLLADSFQRSKDRGARGSPTIYIAGQQYQGGRRANDLLRTICASYSGSKPAACSSIPELPKVNVTLLNDKRCTDCDAKRLEGTLRQRVGNPVVTSLDYGDAEGKRLYDQIPGTLLPAAVFDATLDADTEASAALAHSLKTVGGYKVLTSGGAWNPTCSDAGGCSREECKATLQCRPEEPNKLEVFMMSQCPFAVKGTDAMQEVLATFQGKLDFTIHYIGQVDPTKGLTSMHGQGEVEEDLRELCAARYYRPGDRYLRYIWCRNKDIKSTSWEPCATSGIAAGTLRTCAQGSEGKRLLEESFKLSQSLGMGASPSWLVNGKYKFSGIDADTIKRNVCAHNRLPGCDKTLSGATSPTPPSPAPPSPAPPSGSCGGI